MDKKGIFTSDFSDGRGNGPLENPKMVVVHDSSVSKSGQVSKPKNLDNYHVTFDENGVYLNVPLNQKSYHAADYNEKAVSIAFVGKEGTASKKAIENASKAIAYVSKTLNIPPENFITHPDAVSLNRSNVGPVATRQGGKEATEGNWINAAFQNIKSDPKRYNLTEKEVEGFQVADRKKQEEVVKSVFGEKKEKPVENRAITEGMQPSNKNEQSSTETVSAKNEPQQNKNEDKASAKLEKIKVDANGKIDPVSFAKRAEQMIANSKLNGFVPADGAKFGIKTGSPKEWARFYTMLTQQESTMRVAKVNPDGTLQKFRTTLQGEASYGPGQFNIGEYGLKTWADVNDPEKVIQAYIKQADKYLTPVKPEEAYIQKKVPPGSSWPPNYKGHTGISAYFGSVRDGGEKLAEHTEWFDKSVAPAIGDVAYTAPEQDATKVPTLDQAKEKFLLENENIQHTGNFAQAVQDRFKQWYGENYGEDAAQQAFADVEFSQATPSITETNKEKILEQLQIKPSADAQQQADATKILGKGDLKDQWGVEPGRNTEGVSKKLVASLKAASEDFPLRVRFFSGKTDRNSGAHADGRASDIQIFDENGHPLPSYQNPRVMNVYGMYWQKVKENAEKLYGKKYADSLSWLGADVRASGQGMPRLNEQGGKHTYGAGDSMDIRENAGFTADEAFKVGKGWTKGYEYYVEGDITGIGPKKGKYTDEDYAKLKGLKVTDEQKRLFRKDEKRTGVVAGYSRRLDKWGGEGIGPRQYPMEEQEPLPNLPPLEGTPQATPEGAPAETSALPDATPAPGATQSEVGSPTTGATPPTTDAAPQPPTPQGEQTPQTGQGAASEPPQAETVPSQASPTPPSETSSASASSAPAPSPQPKSDASPAPTKVPEPPPTSITGESVESMAKAASGGVEGAGSGAIRDREKPTEASVATRPKGSQGKGQSESTEGNRTQKQDAPEAPAMSHHPETAAPSPGSPGLGREGRCFV